MACKSGKITKTPMRNPSAEVTPSMKVSEREQAEAKKVKQVRKKELEEYFGKGPRVQAPSREGTPINTVLQQREKGRPDHGEGKERPTKLAPLKGATKAKVQTPQQMEDNGEEGQGGGNTKTKNSKKKSPHKSSDDKTSRKSKRTKLDNEVSVLGWKGLDSLVVNLEAMKELLRKKGAGKAKSMDTEQKSKKSATFAESASKGAPQKPEATVQYNKCVISFAIRVDKGKNTKVGFDKKIIAGLSFLQNYINKHAAFFSIDKSDSSRPPIKEKVDLPAFQVILRRYFNIPNERAFNSVNQEGGRVIKGSAIMGFSLDPRKCLDKAAGDLRHMGCAIFYKHC